MTSSLEYVRAEDIEHLEHYSPLTIDCHIMKAVVLHGKALVSQITQL